MPCLELLERLNKARQIDKDLYQQWRKALSEVGIGRPGYLRFKVSVLPKRVSFSGSNHSSVC